MKKGVVYTRRWIAEFMLDLIGYYSEPTILTQTIVEPSCGNGVFLEAIVNRLCKALLSSPSATWRSLEHCLKGYDIDPLALQQSITVVKNSLLKYGCTEDDADYLINKWLFISDFLLDETVPKCDYVIGNPPYVRSKEIDIDRRELYIERLHTFTKGTDLYIGFYEKSLSLLKENGKHAFICADRWLQNTYGKSLRHYIDELFDLKTLIRLHDVEAFEERVSAYPAITVIKKKRTENCFRYVYCKSLFNVEACRLLLSSLSEQSNTFLSTEYYDISTLHKPNGSSIYPLPDEKTKNWIKEVSTKFPTLEATGVSLGIGIATGCDSVFITENKEIVEPSRLLSLFYMKDYRSGKQNRERFLVNPWDSFGNLVDLKKYPKLQRYFEENKITLQKRHVAKKYPSSWFRTIDKVKPELIEKELLLLPDMALMPDPILSRGKYPHHNCYWIASDEWDMNVLGGLLMSEVVRDFVDAIGVKMRGGTLRFQAQYLRLLHIPPIDSLSKEVKSGLKEAFINNDREMATKFARLAFGLEN